MSPSFRDHAGPNESVWTRFLTILRERGVEERHARWYVLRTEQFLRALPREDFRTYVADDVARYLRETGRKATLNDWQYRQPVDALEILFARTLALPWANRFDWSEVLGQPLELGSFARAKRPQRLPVVLTRQEIRALLEQLNGIQHMMASLLYGTGMRLMEVVRLRVKDIDFGYRQIVVVRNATGAKDKTASSARERSAEGGKGRRPRRRPHEEGPLQFVEAFVCHAPH